VQLAADQFDQVLQAVQAVIQGFAALAELLEQGIGLEFLFLNGFHGG